MTLPGVTASSVLGQVASMPRRAKAGIAVLALLALASISAPLIAPYGEAQILSPESFGYPAEAGPLGTDHLGRDLLSRLLYGGRFTLLLALATTCLAFLTGVSAGFAAALVGGWTDEVVSRIVDGLLSFPSIIMALLMITALGNAIPVLVVTVALIEACRVYRVARALALDVSVLDFVAAARARGEGVVWVAAREVLPNATGPLSAEFGLRFTYVILFVSALSFIGIGVQPPTADWGVMVRENAKGLLYGSSAALLPAACIAVVTIAVNLTIDAFTDRDREARVPEMLP